jgi:hypothetical protein
MSKAIKNTVKRARDRRPDLRSPVGRELKTIYDGKGIDACVSAAARLGLTKLQAFDMCRRWVRQGSRSTKT